MAALVGARVSNLKNRDIYQSLCDVSHFNILNDITKVNNHCHYDRKKKYHRLNCFTTAATTKSVNKVKQISSDAWQSQQYECFAQHSSESHWSPKIVVYKVNEVIGNVLGTNKLLFNPHKNNASLNSIIKSVIWSNSEIKTDIDFSPAAEHG